MSSIKELNLLRCLSPLHAGSGSAIGIVDLPIQREMHTGFPKIESSSLKGALRHAAFRKNGANDHYLKIFGNEAADSELSQSGALTISEARILAFPVKSMHKVFAYVTSPMVLNRLLQEQQAFYRDDLPLNFDNIQLEGAECLVADSSILVKGKVILEEYVIDAKESKAVKDLGKELDKLMQLNGYLSERFIILSDDLFKQFVEHSTDINTRIKINVETGVVEEGALFYEENVPAEALFYAFFTYENSKKAADGVLDLTLTSQAVKDEANKYFGDVFQVGGNATIGRGLIQRFPLEGGQ